uniref:Uncharacterized protein n=1 Tax=Corethrella appendiculata TaxID=1370023 RepID=U5ECR8_9DIPT
MVYESDFYTTRRPYSSRPIVSSYSVTRRAVDWDKVPFVPRPSLIPDPITAYGRKKPKRDEYVSILKTINREAIQPDPEMLNCFTIYPYISARDQTREKVFSEMRRIQEIRDHGKSDNADINIILPRLHGTSNVQLPRRHLYFMEPTAHAR